MDQHFFQSYGIDYEVVVGAGSEFAESEIERILAFLVSQNAHVRETFLRRYVPNATVLAVAKDSHDVVAVCALKAPNPAHNQTIRVCAGYSLGADIPELGYALTHKEHRRRGLGSQLNEEVLRRSPAQIFATVRVPNDDEESNLRRIGFQPKGDSWRGETSMLRLWVRNADAHASATHAAGADAPSTSQESSGQA